MKIWRLVYVLEIGIAFLLLKPAWTQEPQESAGERRPDAAAVERGSQIYRPNCGFCHGLDARGAAGPDLARSLVVLEDVDGNKVGAFLKTGRPDAGMPAFAGLSSRQSADLAAFLHARIEESRARTPMDVNGIVVGNAAEGATFFNGAGKCRGCHNPDTDFQRIGAKYDPFVLQARIINPRGGRGAGPIKPSTVRVTLPSGETIAGRLVAVDDFSVTLIDGSGVRRSFSRDNEVPKVEITDPYQAHLDNLMKITDKQMHDLTAYLVRLK